MRSLIICVPHFQVINFSLVVLKFLKLCGIVVHYISNSSFVVKVLHIPKVSWMNAPNAICSSYSDNVDVSVLSS